MNEITQRENKKYKKKKKEQDERKFLGIPVWSRLWLKKQQYTVLAFKRFITLWERV